MKRKLFSLLVLLLTAVTGAWADATIAKLWVGNSEEVTSEGTITGTGATEGTASVAIENGSMVLTLNNFKFNGCGYNDSGIYYQSNANGNTPLIIKIEGDNEITLPGGTDKSLYGLFLYGGNGDHVFTITGSGSLTVTVGDGNLSNGIYVQQADLVLAGGTVTANAGSAGAEFKSLGVSVPQGTLTIDGGTLKASGSTTSASRGVNVNNNVTIKSGELEAYGYSKGIKNSGGDALVFAEGVTPTLFKAGENEASATDVSKYEGQKYLHVVCTGGDEPAAPTGDGVNYALSVGTNDHSTMKFYVGQDEVTKAKEGETVTIVVTPDENWSIGNVTGQWIAAMAKAPRRTAGIGLLQDVDVTFVSEDAQTRAHTYTFVMERAKAEISVTYKKLLTHADITITVSDVTYSGQAQQPDISVKDGDKNLVQGRDFAVTFSNNTNAGTGIATFRGVGTNYAGEKKVEFKVNKDKGSVLFYPSECKKTFGDANFILKPNIKGDGVLTFKSDKPEIAAVDAATGEVTIKSTGKVTIRVNMAESDNYFGSTDWCELIIAPKAMANGMFAEISTPVYTGEALVPTVVMKDGETVMKANTDYTLAFEDNLNAGTAKVTATGVGNYQGTATATFTIGQAALTAVTLAKTSLVYNQQEQTAQVTSVNAGNVEVPADGYEVTGNKGTNVGTYTATITGKGNFKGSVTAQFSIVADAEAVFDMTLDPTEYVYDGTEKKPAVTVKDGNAVLVEGTDYTLTYANNINAGTAKVTATGKGNYACTKTVEYTIKKADVTMTAPEAKANLVYNAQAQTLVAAGTVQGGEMQYALDDETFATALPTGTDAKEYTVSYKVVGDQNHNDVEAQTIKVTIAQAALTAATLKETNLVYNQQEQTALVASVSAGTLTVPEGSYEVTGNKGTNVGTYTATITGKGNFKGSVTAQFSIVADNSVLFDLTLNPTEYVYDGTEKKPAVTVKNGETVLVEGTDYTLAYTNNVNAGTAKVTATGKGNYACTKTAEFTIKKADVTMTAPEAKANLVYNAQAQALVAAGTVQGGEMQYASDGENFSTTLPTGTDAKEYTVYFKVVGDQNHNDVEAQNFKVTIDKAALTAATLAKTSLVYNQQEQTAQVTSVNAGNVEVPADGYEVTGNKGTNVGTYTATITGKGNFKGSVTAQFSIVADAEAVLVMTLDATEYVYDGTEKKPAVTVKNGETVLVEGTDYTLAYANNVNAGTAKVTATGKGNYASTKTVEYTIKKVQLTIKVDDAQVICGKEAPQYEVSYEGFVAEETKDVLEGTLTITCDYTKESPAGSTYDITPSGLTSKNYDITFVPGKLTVLVDQAAVDQAAADDVMGKITAIGEVAYNETSKGLIDAAREAYNALTDAQKALVTNLETLTNAETAYANLKAAAEKAAADQLAAGEVIDKIIAIGEVAYTDACKALIDAARNAYSELTADQKALVTNYEVLTTAETTYANLKAAAEKAAADKLAADDVIAKINAIGEVAYTEACKNLIDAARNAYTALTEDQKALVTNLSVLTDAETAYAELAQIATGISTIKAIAGKTIYDMNGRKVTVPSKKGMYIINGKKVVVK